MTCSILCCILWTKCLRHSIISLFGAEYLLFLPRRGSMLDKGNWTENILIKMFIISVRLLMGVYTCLDI